MRLLGFLKEDAIVTEMKSGSKDGAIRELIEVLVEKGEIAEGDQEPIVKAILDREARGSTGLGEGIAIPHVKDCSQVDGLIGAFGRSSEGIPFDAVDGNPVHLMFLIVGGGGTTAKHIEILKKLALLRMNEHFLRFLRDAKDVTAIADIIREMSGSVA